MTDFFRVGSLSTEKPGFFLAIFRYNLYLNTVQIRPIPPSQPLLPLKRGGQEVAQSQPLLPFLRGI